MSKAGGVAIGGAVFAWVMCLIACAAAWVTHVIWIVKALSAAGGATAGQMFLGAIGTLVPPIGIIHGLVIWFS